MTFKQVLFRYLKDFGYFGFIYGSECKFGDDSPFDIFWQLKILFRKKNIWWPYYFKNYKDFIKEYTTFKYSITPGDICSVKTSDGKHTVDYKVMAVNNDEHVFTHLDNTFYNFNWISIDRIVAVNGKPVDFKDGWEYNEKIFLI